MCDALCYSSHLLLRFATLRGVVSTGSLKASVFAFNLSASLTIFRLNFLGSRIGARTLTAHAMQVPPNNTYDMCISKENINAHSTHVHDNMHTLTVSDGDNRQHRACATNISCDITHCGILLSELQQRVEFEVPVHPRRVAAIWWRVWVQQRQRVAVQGLGTVHAQQRREPTSTGHEMRNPSQTHPDR
jgi:hypothetical protein